MGGLGFRIRIYIRGGFGVFEFFWGVLVKGILFFLVYVELEGITCLVCLVVSGGYRILLSRNLRDFLCFRMAMVSRR